MSDSGITEEQWGQLRVIFERIVGLKKVVLFGSRATGKYRNGSDVDLVVWIEEVDDVVSRLRGALEESALPYFFDVVDYGQLGDDQLRVEIERDGVGVWERVPGAVIK